MADQDDSSPVDASTEKLFDFVEFDIEVEKLVSAVRDYIASPYPEMLKLMSALRDFDTYKEKKK